MNYIDAELKMIKHYLESEERIEIFVSNEGGHFDGVTIKVFKNRTTDESVKYIIGTIWYIENREVVSEEVLMLLSKTDDNGDSVPYSTLEKELFLSLGFSENHFSQYFELETMGYLSTNGMINVNHECNKYLKIINGYREEIEVVNSSNVEELVKVLKKTIESKVDISVMFGKNINEFKNSDCSLDFLQTLNLEDYLAFLGFLFDMENEDVLSTWLLDGKLLLLMDSLLIRL